MAEYRAQAIAGGKLVVIFKIGTARNATLNRNLIKHIPALCKDMTPKNVDDHRWSAV